MTQLTKARAGIITPEMKVVAKKEQVDPVWLKDQIAEGRVVIPANIKHKCLQGPDVISNLKPVSS